VEVDDAIGEGFGGKEFEADEAMARLNEGDAFADEDGDDVDAELVDFALVQKGGDDFAAAHIQICLPGWARRRWAKALIGSFTNSKVGTSDFCGWREKT
jgi:hypothetical protein